MTAAARTGPRARVRHVAGRFVGWAFETAGGPPPGLASANGTVLDDRPVVVVVLLGADAEAVTATATDLVAAMRAGGPRPVLVLDRPHFAAARRAGVTADHVLSPEDWAARGYTEDWRGYLAGELDRLRHDLRTGHVVTLPPQGSPALDPVAWRAALTAPAGAPGRGPSGPLARWWRRIVVRLERRIDRPSGGS